MVDVYIALGRLIPIERGEGDVTAIPPETSLVAEQDWPALCKEAGGEDKLLAALSVKEDMRAVTE